MVKVFKNVNSSKSNGEKLSYAPNKLLTLNNGDRARISPIIKSAAAENVSIAFFPNSFVPSMTLPLSALAFLFISSADRLTLIWLPPPPTLVQQLGQ